MEEQVNASSRPFVLQENGVGRELCCGTVSLQDLAKRHGTPLYVYAGDQIVKRAAMFEESFGDRPHTVCYAVKANSSLAILKLLGERGCGFDIVSGGELERVLAAAGKHATEWAGRVVFSGVGKTAPEMDAALEAGILMFNVESEAELGLLEERAKSAGKVAKFALRVNPDVFAETHPYISTGLSAHKFGIGIALAREVYRRVQGSEWLKAVGVSVHIGSQIRQVDPFAAALRRVVDLVQQLREDGHAIQYVDAGGGLGIEYGQEEFDASRQVHLYANALRAPLADLEVHLLIEPGRFLVGQAGALVTRVLYTKRNGETKFVIVDAAMNDLIRPALYQAHHEIVPVWAAKFEDGTTETVDVVGPVCESGDFFARQRELPVLEQGDLLALLDAGAYGMSLSSNYNTRLRPAEVLVERNASRLIRRRETYEELFAAEMME